MSKYSACLICKEEGAVVCSCPIDAKDRRIAELEAQVADAKSAMKIQSDGYMRLKGENDTLVAQVAELNNTKTLAQAVVDNRSKGVVSSAAIDALAAALEVEK